MWAIILKITDLLGIFEQRSETLFWSEQNVIFFSKWNIFVDCVFLSYCHLNYYNLLMNRNIKKNLAHSLSENRVIFPDLMQMNDYLLKKKLSKIFFNIFCNKNKNFIKIWKMLITWKRWGIGPLMGIKTSYIVGISIDQSLCQEILLI